MSFDPKAHLTDLRGRDYLEVKWRLVWFREDYPTGGINTEVINFEPLVIRATIVVDGNIIATGHGTADDSGKNVVWKGKAIEKAETAAIGRALAHAGYGTQFSPDDDEEGVVDSPVYHSQSSQNAQKSALAPTTPQPTQNAKNGYSPEDAQADVLANNGEAPTWFTTLAKDCFGTLKQYLLKEFYNNSTFHMNGSLDKHGITTSKGQKLTETWAGETAGKLVSFLQLERAELPKASGQ